MARDLGTGTNEVHQAAEVLRFWLEETPRERHFVRDDALDRECATRFGQLRDHVLASNAAGWSDEPRRLLAAVILLDQFSRNIHRDIAEAYAADPLARSLSRLALIRGWGAAMSPVEQQFLWMPFMHSENMADQLVSVRLFEATGEAMPADFARRHAAQIARFGRFPQRNPPLGRETTALEAEFLSRPGASF